MKMTTRYRSRARITVAACLSSLLLGSSAATATQQGATAEPRDHYVPRAGYLRTVDILAFRRGRSIRVAPGAPGQVTSLTGRRAIPTILLEFDNISGPFTSLAYHNQLFGNLAASPPQPTISQYYRDMSQGQFEVTGRVIGWFRLPNKDRHYEGPKHGTGTGFGEFLKFGLDQADALVDFGEFDNDGPDGLPNSGDDDGIVDTVFFVHPEAGAECGTFGEQLNIWAHSWHYSEPTYGHTGMYETNDVQLNPLQVPVLNDDGTEKRIMIEDYTVQPGLACPASPGSIARIVPIGVYAHEYGHALGLPDLYDRTPSGNPDSNGIGDWGLMAGGSWGFGRRPEMPTRMSAWSLARLGWATLEILDSSSPVTLTLEPVQERNRVHVIDVPGSNGVEYFLLELKDPNWTDSMGLRLNWDEDLPKAGLAIWHVDDNVGSASGKWPFADSDQGQNDAPSLPNATSHSLIALEQADCLLNLERKTNEGDNADLWEAGKTFGAGTCNGGSDAYDGTQTGIIIENIDLSQLSANLKRQMALGPPSAPVFADTTIGEEADDSDDPVFAAAPAASPPVMLAARPELSALTEHTAEMRMARQASLEAVNASLTAEQSVAALSDEQQATLLRASTAQIEYGVDLQQQKEVKAWVSEQRQYQIQVDYEPETELQEGLKGLWQASGSDTPIQAQFDASATRIDRVTGLNLPSGHESIAADADERKDTTFKPLLGENVQLQQMSVEPDSTARQFQQIYEMDGTKLPVFSKGASFYYDKQNVLKAFSAQIVDSDELVIAGTAGQLDQRTANEIVIQQLGLPANRAESLKDSGEGIYLVDQDPSQARVVRRLYLPAAGNRDDIVIFVDEETQAVIGIE